jgi:4-hydroxy-3-methylbut-2-enyl diphosphate reductase
VRRLWLWAARAVDGGYGVLIFGRPLHDETVVTKSRLAQAGGAYLVARDLKQVEQFCELITRRDSASLTDRFAPEATNAETLQPFLRLAQVSQTTMLYGETMKVRELLTQAFAERFGDQADDHLLFEPTVCRATQDRQTAAVELCRERPDLVVVVGGFGSSNTRHLYELARAYAPAVFIEDAGGIDDDGRIHTFDLAAEQPRTLTDWLPRKRPLRIGVLAGASSPECVVGETLEKLAAYLK